MSRRSRKKEREKDANKWLQRNLVNSEIRLPKQAYYQNTFNEYMITLMNSVRLI